MRVAGSVSLLRQLMKDPPNAFDADALSSTFLMCICGEFSPGTPAEQPSRGGGEARGKTLPGARRAWNGAAPSKTRSGSWEAKRQCLGALHPVPFHKLVARQALREAHRLSTPPPRACQWWEPRRGRTCCSE